MAFPGSTIGKFHQHLFHFTKLALKIYLDEIFYLTVHALIPVIWGNVTAVKKNSFWQCIIL